MVPLDCRVTTSSLLAMTESKIQPAFSRMRTNAKLTVPLLPEIVEGLDLGIAEGAVVDAEVVEGAVQVILGAGDRLAHVKQGAGVVFDVLVNGAGVLGPVYISVKIPVTPCSLCTGKGQVHP
jgi:hypothetical protein